LAKPIGAAVPQYGPAIQAAADLAIVASDLLTAGAEVVKTLIDDDIEFYHVGSVGPQWPGNHDIERIDKGITLRLRTEIFEGKKEFEGFTFHLYLRKVNIHVGEWFDLEHILGHIPSGSRHSVAMNYNVGATATGSSGSIDARINEGLRAKFSRIFSCDNWLLYKAQHTERFIPFSFTVSLPLSKQATDFDTSLVQFGKEFADQSSTILSRSRTLQKTLQTAALNNEIKQLDDKKADKTKEKDKVSKKLKKIPGLDDPKLRELNEEVAKLENSAAQLDQERQLKISQLMSIQTTNTVVDALSANLDSKSGFGEATGTFLEDITAFSHTSTTVVSFSDMLEMKHESIVKHMIAKDENGKDAFGMSNGAVQTIVVKFEKAEKALFKDHIPLFPNTQQAVFAKFQDWAAGPLQPAGLSDPNDSYIVIDIVAFKDKPMTPGKITTTVTTVSENDGIKTTVTSEISDAPTVTEKKEAVKPVVAVQ